MPNACNRTLTGKRILVVEDDWFLATDLVERIKTTGAEIIGPVPTVPDALDLIERSDALDLALLDVQLADQTSFPIAEAVKARGVKLAFVTSCDATMIPIEHHDVPLYGKSIAPAEIAQLLTLIA